MKTRVQILFAIILSIAFNAVNAQPFEFVNAFPNLSFSTPVFVTHANDGTNRVFIVEKTGTIRVLPNDSNTTDSRIFLNISDRTLNGSERGLLGLAFHPNYANNGYFYVDYTRAGDGATVVSRFNRTSSDPNKADSLSELILLTIPQPFSNHNGGIVFFGLDGYLHIGMGDGGSGGDPGNRAQNLNELLGKVLRINVDSVAGGNNYSIPPTNPFAQGGGRPEIFTIGMRNPWRIGQDPVTGLIWCADVGQDAWEEIDLLEVGKNYGWRCYEGNNPYNTSGCGPSTDYTFPIKVYQNVGSDCSVTGGYVYRGSRRPELTGQYIYGDYCSRKVWRLRYEGGQVTGDSLIATSPASILSFGMDQNRELYLCGSNGIVYRFNRSDLVGVNSGSSAIADEFRLDQNYPNPFNPETKISYYVPALSKMKMTIFNSLGSEVVTLVNTVQLPGQYDISWNGKDASGNNISSGVYYYNLTSDKGFSDTKKMLLVK